MNLFDILGPVMVPPSSFSTAERSGRLYLQKILQDHVVKAETFCMVPCYYGHRTRHG